MSQPQADSGSGPGIDPKILPKISIESFRPSAEDREKMRKALGIEHLIKQTGGKKPS